MKGWLFISTDGSIDFRTDEFFHENPGFLSDNRDFLIWAGRFDTEDIGVMMNAFLNLKMVSPKNHEVLQLCKRIGFDITKLTDYANSIR